jgi:hypothetical protein
MSKTIEELLAPKPVARPRIYAYAIADKAHAESRSTRRSESVINRHQLKLPAAS